MSRPLDVRSKWLWFRSLGAMIAITPGVVCVVILAALSQDFGSAEPFLQYLGVSTAALLLGYALMKKGMQEEERERIRQIVREVLAEAKTPSIPTEPVNQGAKVIQLPIREKEDASS